MPVGRPLRCVNCGHMWESDCITPWCSTECREEDLRKTAELDARIKAEIEKTKPPAPPMYHI